MRKDKIQIFLELLLIILLLFPCLAYGSDASYETHDHLLYRIENDTAVITGYTGNEQVLVIPVQLGGYKVTCIDELAFAHNNLIWTVILPPTITKIRQYAFHMSSIRSIILSDALQSIEDGAFSHSHLTSIYLPSSVTRIGSGVFSGCLWLSSIRIDARIKEIPYRTFFECIKLYDVQLPGCLETISEEAFYYCITLRDIEIPTNVIFIDDSAFYDCRELWDHPVLKDYAGVYEGDDVAFDE